MAGSEHTRQIHSLHSLVTQSSMPLPRMGHMWKPQCWGSGKLEGAEGAAGMDSALTQPLLSLGSGSLELTKPTCMLRAEQLP